MTKEEVWVQFIAGVQKGREAHIKGRLTIYEVATQISNGTYTLIQAIQEAEAEENLGKARPCKNRNPNNDIEVCGLPLGHLGDHSTGGIVNRRWKNLGQLSNKKERADFVCTIKEGI